MFFAKTKWNAEECAARGLPLHSLELKRIEVVPTDVEGEVDLVLHVDAVLLPPPVEMIILHFTL